MRPALRVCWHPEVILQLHASSPATPAVVQPGFVMGPEKQQLPHASYPMQSCCTPVAASRLMQCCS